MAYRFALRSAVAAAACVCASAGAALAGSVSGYAYLSGETDHSGISVNISDVPSIAVPTLTEWGLLLTLLAISTALAWNRKKAPAAIVGLLALGFGANLAHAAFTQTVVTDASGFYQIDDIPDGNYILSLSATGFTTESIDEIKAVGDVFAPTIVLSPVAAGTQTPTATPSGNLINAWHYPFNLEGFLGDTMRFPVAPTDADTEVFAHVGIFPSGDADGGTLYYKSSADVTWQSAAIAFSHNNAIVTNDYWSAAIPLAGFSGGDTVEYYFEVTSNAGKDTTYVYGDDASSFGTEVEATAQSSPYTFTILTSTPTPTITPTPTVTATPDPNANTPTPTNTPLPLANVFHIPDNMEPPSVTMRNPFEPGSDVSDVFIYFGTVNSTSVNAATLHYKLDSDSVWSTANFAFDSGNGGNIYFISSFPGPFSTGETYEYYIEVDALGFSNTYIHYPGGNSTPTGDEATAQGDPFTVTFLAPPPTPTPTNTVPPTETPTITPTPTPNLMNAFHVPGNTVACLDTPPYQPVVVDGDNVPYDFYLGVFPSGAGFTGLTIHYRVNSGSWQSFGGATFGTELDYKCTVSGTDDFFFTFPTLDLNAGDTVEYYFEADKTGFDTTYVYSPSGSGATGLEATAQGAPFSLTVVAPTPAPTPTNTGAPTNTPSPTPTITPTSTPTPNLMNAFHVPGNTVACLDTPPYQPVVVDGDNVPYDFYLGVFPSGAGFTGLTIHYRVNSGSWQSFGGATFGTELDYKCTVGGTDDFFFTFPTLDLNAGDTVEYYFEADKTGFDTTFVYSPSGSGATGLEATAQGAPFSLTVVAPTPTPTPTPSPTPTQTPTPGPSPTPAAAGNLFPSFYRDGQNVVNCFDGSSVITPPYSPTFTAGTNTYDFLMEMDPSSAEGANFQQIVNYRINGGAWNSTTGVFGVDQAYVCEWDSDARKWFSCSATLTLTSGDTVEYYLEVRNTSGVYAATYTYSGDRRHDVESVAQAFPYSVTVP